MTKITIFNQEQLAKYKDIRFKLITVENPPPGFVGEQVEVVKSASNGGYVLHNPKLGSRVELKRADAILKELYKETSKIIKWKNEIEKKGFDKFKPEFPFMIEI